MSCLTSILVFWLNRLLMTRAVFINCHFFLRSLLSFVWTRMCLGLMWGLLLCLCGVSSWLVVLLLWFPWLYRMVIAVSTLFPSFIVFFSFALCFLILHLLVSFVCVRLGSWRCSRSYWIRFYLHPFVMMLLPSYGVCLCALGCSVNHVRRNYTPLCFICLTKKLSLDTVQFSFFFQCHESLSHSWRDDVKQLHKPGNVNFRDVFWN